MPLNLKLTHGEKILLFLFEVGQGQKVKMRYEDIVVGLFKKYPQDFHLKGHKEYPDSGDMIHKPLYDFKKKGLIEASSKIFSLTDRGLESAEQLLKREISGKESSNGRLSRSTETEVSRIKSSEGFLLFAEGKKNEVSEADFYNYLGVTVRTQRNTFIGRLENLKSMSTELKESKDVPLYSTLVDYHEFLLLRYANIIDLFLKN